MVRAGRRTRRLRLREGLLEAPNVNVRIAYLSGLASIDRRPGAEILVTLNGAASGSAVGVYTHRAGRLLYMPIAGRNRIEGLFWHVVAGLGGVRADCFGHPGSGYVISMSYDAHSPPGANITRVLYRVDGFQFRRIWERRYRHSYKRFPEQRADGAFGSCLVSISA